MLSRTLLALTLAATLLVAAGGSAAAAPREPEHCPPQFSQCNADRFGYWIPMQISGVETVASVYRTPKALALYQHLIGPHLQVPEHPRARIIFNDIRLGTYTPGAQDLGPTKNSSRYLEYGVELLAKYGPHESWHDLRLILNDRAGMELGRGDIPPFGVYGATPKFLADNTYDAN